jgi:hypothetical protein
MSFNWVLGIARSGPQQSLKENEAVHKYGFPQILSTVLLAGKIWQEYVEDWNQASPHISKFRVFTEYC